MNRYAGKCDLCRERDLEYEADGTYKDNAFTTEQLEQAVKNGLRVDEQKVMKDIAVYHCCPTCYAQVKRRLEGKGGCFIATACYGAYDHPAVQEFRWFRDNRLDQHPWGRRLVDAYYRLSPPIAAFLQERPVVAATVRRCLLAPILRLVVSARKGTRS